MKQTVFRSIAPLALFLSAAATVGVAADSWKHITREENPMLPGNEIQFLGPAKDGGVWVGTLAGAARAKGTVLSPLEDGKGGVFNKSVWWVLDAPDRTWVGHQQGLLEGRGGAWKSSLAGYTVAPVYEAAPGMFWALGKNDATDAATLFEYRGKEWKQVEALAKKRLTNVFRLPNGRLWITIDGNGALEVDPAAGIDKAVHHLQGMNVTSVFQDSKGRIWCGLWANGIAVWDGTAWRRELPKEKKSAILMIVEDSGGSLWAATTASGLWHRPVAGTEWVNDLADEGSICLLTITADGRIWVSSQAKGGLRYWNGTAWVVSLESPLPIRALVEAADGSLWAGSVLDGLYVLSRGTKAK